MNQLGTTNSLQSNTFIFNKEYRIDNNYAPKRYMIYEARKIYETIFPRTKFHQCETSSSFHLDQDRANFPLKIGEYYVVPPFNIQDVDNLTNQTIAEILKEGEKNFVNKYKNKLNDGSLANVDSKEIKRRLNDHIKKKTEAEELKRDFQILMQEDILQFESKCNCFPANDHSYFTGKKSLWKLMRRKIKGSYTFTVNFMLSQFASTLLKCSDKLYKNFLSSVSDIGLNIEKISFLMSKQAKYLEKLKKSSTTEKILGMDDDFKKYCSCCIEVNEENIKLKNILVKTYAKFLKVNQPYKLTNKNMREDLNNLIKKLREYRHFIKAPLPKRAKVLETLENIMISESKNVENSPLQNFKALGVKEEKPQLDNRFARNVSNVEYKHTSTEKRKRGTVLQDRVKFPHDTMNYIHKDLTRTHSTVTWKSNLEVDDHENEQDYDIWSGQSIEAFDRDKSLTSIIYEDGTQQGRRKSRLFSVKDSLDVLDERKLRQHKNGEPDIRSTLRPSIKKTNDSLILIRRSILGSVSFKNINEHQPSVPESVAESAFSGREAIEIDNLLKLKPNDSLLLFCKFLNNIIPKDKSNVLKTSSVELGIQDSLKSILKQSSTDFPSTTSSAAEKRVRISHAEIIDPKPVVNFDEETEIIIPRPEMDAPTSTESGQNSIKNATFCHIVGEKNRNEYLQSLNEFLIRRIDSLAKLMKKFPWLNECYYKDQNISKRKSMCDVLYFNNNFYI